MTAAAGTVVASTTNVNAIGGWEAAEATNQAVAGASETHAEVSFPARLEAQPAVHNWYYWPGCQYVGPGEPYPDLGYAGSGWGDVPAEGTFTPMLFVDERFVTGVPEPMITALLIAGLAALGWRRRAPQRDVKAARTSS